MKTAIIIEHPDDIDRKKIETIMDNMIEVPSLGIDVVPAVTGEQVHNLQRSLRDDAIAIWWNAADIDDRARNRDIILTEGQIMNVLDALKSQHNASIGLNWDVIDTYTDTELRRDE